MSTFFYVPSYAANFSDFAKFGKDMDFYVQHKNIDMAICIGFVGYNKIKLRYCHHKTVANSPIGTVVVYKKYFTCL
jgi:hypothetical protein